QEAGFYSYVIVLDENDNQREVTVTVIAAGYPVTAVEGDLKEGDRVLLGGFGGGHGGGGGRDDVVVFPMTR
ncbi:MAG: hypothetical protein FWD45_06520, partial [Coriobacteriia bacterium]|nr:hypothetical protein [Coriobacteriia bacterium]